MVRKKKLQFNKREILLLLIIMTAVLYYFGWQLSGENSYREIIKVRHELNSYKDEQVLLLNLVEDGQNLEAKWLNELDQREYAAKVLPDLADLPLVLRDKESFLNNKPVSINGLAIGDTLYHDHHAAVPMHLKIKAEPHHLLNLMEQLELLPNIIYLDYLKWQNRAESVVEMELQLQLLFYNPDLSAN